MPDLGHDYEDHAHAGPGSAPGSRLSRRRVMTASAVVAGVGLASAPAAAEAGTDGQAVSLGESGTTTVEFRGRVTQSGSTGQSFTSYGYLIRASHADESDLFSGTPLSEATALLTVYATGDLRARTTDNVVHALDIAGTMTVYQRSSPGASFSDPSSEVRPVFRRQHVRGDVLSRKHLNPNRASGENDASLRGGLALGARQQVAQKKCDVGGAFG